MSYLTKDAILAAQDIETEDVSVPLWGGVVRVRGLTGTDRDAFEESLLDGKGKNRQVRLANFRAKLVSLCVVDEKNERVFTDAEVTLLGRKSAMALSHVSEVAQRLSGLSEEDVEEIAGNLSPIPGDASS